MCERAHPRPHSQAVAEPVCGPGPSGNTELAAFPSVPAGWGSLRPTRVRGGCGPPTRSIQVSVPVLPWPDPHTKGLRGREQPSEQRRVCAERSQL